MFLVKKLVAPLLFPLPLCAAFLVVGVLLLRTGKRRRAGAIAVTIGTVLLLLFGSPLPNRALESLEQEYPPYLAAASAGRSVQWIAILSGGSADDPRLPVTSQLSAVSIARIAEGIRIAGLHPEARVLVSGGSTTGNRRPEAELMRDLCVILGVPRERIVVEGQTRDTEEQAAAVKQITGKDALILVTSASHLPRSMALFRTQGMDPIPAPAEHHVKRNPEAARLPLRALCPSVTHLEAATIVAYERLGLLWSRLRGRG